MKQGLKGLLGVALIMGVPMINEATNCARCKKIEAEREERQLKEGPPTLHYYDDHIKQPSNEQQTNETASNIRQELLLAQTTATKPISRSWVTDPTTPSDYMNQGPTLRASDTGAAGSSGNRTSPYESPTTTGVVTPISRTATRPIVTTPPTTVQTQTYYNPGTSGYPAYPTSYPSYPNVPPTGAYQAVPPTGAYQTVLPEGAPASYPLPGSTSSTMYPAAPTVQPGAAYPYSTTMPSTVYPTAGAERTLSPTHDVPQQVVPTDAGAQQINVTPYYNTTAPGTGSIIQTPGTVNQIPPISPSISPEAYSAIFAILQTPDVIKTLNGPFTAFVPSNQAFNQIPPQTMRELLLPENQSRLAIVVGNHIVPFKIASTEVQNLVAKTISGKSLDIRYTNGVMTVNGARVLRADNVGANGVIYVIDGVILY